MSNRIIVSSNIRNVTADKSSGTLFTIDLDKFKVLQSTSGIEVPGRKYDSNPRGGMRGMRGLSIYNGQLAVATYSSVLIFDRFWNLVQLITHPSVAAIHEIYYCEAGLWVTSTANDILINFNHSGKIEKYYYLHDQKELNSLPHTKKDFILNHETIMTGVKDFRTRSYAISDNYDRYHLNSLCQEKDGRMIMSLGMIIDEKYQFQAAIKSKLRKTIFWSGFLKINRIIRTAFGLKKRTLSDLIVQPTLVRSAILSLNPDNNWVKNIMIPIAQNPSHSVRILDDGTLLYLLTSSGELLHFTQDGKILSRIKISEKFLRGLMVLPDGKLLIGASNELILFDTNENKISSVLIISDNDQEYIFDIAKIPDNFELPAASLEEKIGKLIRYEGENAIWGK